jgi:hypothetical protein
MPDDLEIKTDYDVGGSSTSIVTPTEAIATPEVEIHKYGIGKPTRVVIRAKISHETNDQN